MNTKCTKRYFCQVLFKVRINELLWIRNRTSHWEQRNPPLYILHKKSIIVLPKRPHKHYLLKYQRITVKLLTISILKRWSNISLWRKKQDKLFNLPIILSGNGDIANRNLNLELNYNRYTALQRKVVISTCGNIRQFSEGNLWLDHHKELITSKVEKWVKEVKEWLGNL